MGSLELLILFLGCFSDPNPLKKARYYLEDSPGQATQFIQLLPPEEQVYVVTQLAEENPQKVMPLCEILKKGSAQERCKRIATRPHLWKPPVGATPEPPPQNTDCAHPHQCATEKANRALAQKNWTVAQQACQSISSIKWKEECLFHISEEMLKHDLSLYAKSLDICAGLTQFQKNCEQHGVFFYAKTLHEKKLDWETLKNEVQIFHRIWQTKRPLDGDRILSHLWGQLVTRHYEEISTSSQSYPADLQVHFRSIHALRSLQYVDSIPPDLEAFGKAIQEGRIQKLREKPIGIETRFNFWKGVAPEHSASYLGHSIRIVDADPNVDYLIALLEAVARLRPPNKSLLLPYAQHKHPKVSDTAKRLLSFDPKDSPILLESLF